MPQELQFPDGFSEQDFPDGFESDPQTEIAEPVEEEYPLLRKIGQRLTRGYADEDRDAMLAKGINSLNGIDLATGEDNSSILPRLEHPKDEGWPGYIARGLYNTFIQPLGSAEGMLGATNIGPKPRIRLKLPVEAAKVADNVAPVAAEVAEQTPIQKLLAAIGEAKPLRGKQARLYTAERQQRLGKMADVTAKGEQGYIERLSKLKGEMPKVHFESIRPQLQQTDVDDLMNAIQDDKRLMDFEKLHAQTGLAKLLGEYGGHVPQENEIALLEKVFGKELTDVVRSQMPMIDKASSLVSDLANVPRAIQASTDLSAPFRQGLGLIHKKEWWTSWDDMIRSFGSQRVFDATQDSIRMKPTFELSQDAGLFLTDLTHLSNREEQFMSTIAEKIPGMGRVVRASNRGYVAFLNKLRSDTFDSLAKNLIDSGVDPKKNLHLFKEMADFVNNATGRGSLGKMEKNAVMLNNLFFSPRLIASRVNMLNPATYVKASPQVRKEYLKSAFAMSTAGTILTTLGKATPGVEVEYDPRSSDFGKLKIGNTRLDPHGGFQQYLVATTRFLTGKQKSPESGNITDLTAGQFGRPTRMSIAGRFGRSKLNPILAYAYDLAEGKDFIGQPIEFQERTMELFTPMLIQDIIDLAQEDPTLLPFAIPAGTGMGVDVHKPRKSNRLLAR